MKNVVASWYFSTLGASDGWMTCQIQERKRLNENESKIGMPKFTSKRVVQSNRWQFPTDNSINESIHLKAAYLIVILAPTKNYINDYFYGNHHGVWNFQDQYNLALNKPTCDFKIENHATCNSNLSD